MSRALTLVTVLSLALVAASCNQQHHDHNAQQQNGTTGSGNTGSTENATDFRTACADDIQKYCADNPRKRRCLRDNIDRLSDACRSAVTARGNYGNGGGFGDGGREGGNVRIRSICADDIQKFCANDEHKKRCLRNNLDQLSDACKAAVNAPRGQLWHRGDDGNDDQ